jgi:SNF2 family DNA or RNA helicase
VIALILANPATADQWALENPQLMPSNATLIVVPVSLLTQWAQELAEKAPGLTVVVYYGKKEETNRLTTVEVAAADVVLTTFGIVEELTPSKSKAKGQKRHGGQKQIFYKMHLKRKRHLKQIHFYRLVIDECQFAKNDTRKISQVQLFCNSSALFKHFLYIHSLTLHSSHTGR